jgi:MFS family permease
MFIQESILTRKLVNYFPALCYRNFRLFWVGQLISLIGTWMQNIGQAWLVLQLTDSAFKLGVVNALQFLPLTVFSLFVGPFVDRFPKRKILLGTQISLMVLAFILAALTALNKIQYWHILILALGLGMANTVDIPARQAFFIELVGKDSLMNAIALNSTVFNLGRVLGPAVGGILIGLLGMAPCFFLNAFSFCAVLLGLWLIDAPPMVTKNETKILADIVEGLSYVRRKAIILLPLVLLAFIGTFVINFNVLVPVLAKENLGQNALGFGFLMSCIGLGSLTGALSLAGRSNDGPRLKTLLGGACGASFLVALLGLEGDYILACLTLFVIGFCTITFVISVNSTIQINSEDRMRGRVMSIYALVNGGVTPFGSLFAGQVSEVAGTQPCLIVSGVIGLVAVTVVTLLFRKSPQASHRKLDA